MRPAAKRRLGGALAGAIALGVLAACGAEPGPPEVGCGELHLGEGTPERSVVLVLVDTLRRDAPGAYGGAAETPAFDRVASEGLLFERSWSQAPWTKPGVASLFTSLYPSQHGVATHPSGGPAAHLGEAPEAPRSIRQTDLLHPELVTLAELYRDAGFATAGFVSNPWMAKGLGFGQGFETWDDSMARWGAPGEAVSLAALRWLRARPERRPYFLYLHYLEPHRPYGRPPRERVRAHAEAIRAEGRPAAEHVAREIARLVRYPDGGSPVRRDGLPPNRRLLELAYHQGASDFDAALAAFLRGHARQEGAGEAALLVTSDHGESLYEHGFGNHGSSLYEAEVAVPFAARLPGVAPQPARVRCPVTAIDVMPLLCRYSGLDCPAQAMGRDHLLAGGEDAPPPRLVMEGVGGAPRHRALREGRWKLVWEPDRPDAPEWLLFDLEADPAEQRNLAAEGAPEQGAAGRAFRELSRALPEAVPDFDTPARRSVPLSDELSERLESLGYVE